MSLPSQNSSYWVSIIKDRLSERLKLACFSETAEYWVLIFLWKTYFQFYARSFWVPGSLKRQSLHVIWNMFPHKQILYICRQSDFFLNNSIFKWRVAVVWIALKKQNCPKTSFMSCSELSWTLGVFWRRSEKKASLFPAFLYLCIRIYTHIYIHILVCSVSLKMVQKWCKNVLLKNLTLWAYQKEDASCIWLDQSKCHYI